MTTKIERIVFGLETQDWQSPVEFPPMVFTGGRVTSRDIKNSLGVDIPNLEYVEDTNTTTVRAKRGRKILIEVFNGYVDEDKRLIEYQFNPTGMVKEIVVKKQQIGDEIPGIRITRL